MSTPVYETEFRDTSRSLAKIVGARVYLQRRRITESALKREFMAEMERVWQSALNTADDLDDSESEPQPRRVAEEEGRWVTLHNGRRVKIDDDGKILMGYGMGRKISDLNPEPKGTGSGQAKGYEPAKKGMVGDTRERYIQKDGTYTPERQKLHDQIAAKLIGNAKPVDKPAIYMMGGGPASGKGSLLKKGYVPVPENRAHIDADEVKGNLPEYQAMVADKNKLAAAFAHEESSDVSKRVLDHSIKNKLNVIFDGTGNGAIEDLKKKIDKMRANGHRIVAHYVTIDVDEAIKRADARYEHTGRYVPHAVIRKTHQNVAAAVPQALKAGLFDEFTLWDNGGKEKDSPPVKVAEVKEGKLQILNRELWSAFLKRGGG